MDSKDLPVTEWWDPDWDVYDVPLSPFEDDRVDVDTWWAAYEHGWILNWILAGSAAYIPFRFDHQLTAGPPSLASEPAAEQFERLLRDLAACSCRYVLARVAGAPGPWVQHRAPGMRRRELLTRCFVIDPQCLHHGERRRIIRTTRSGAVIKMHPDDWAALHAQRWEDTLTDEDERR